MEKLGFYDFITLVLPGVALALLLYIFGNFNVNTLPVIFMENEFIGVLTILLFGYLAGFLVSYVGIKMEMVLDKLKSFLYRIFHKEMKHPLVHMLEKFIHDKQKIKLIHAPEFFYKTTILEKEVISEVNTNFTFDLMRESLSQSGFGSKTEILNAQAIFLRNMVAVALLVFLWAFALLIRVKYFSVVPAISANEIIQKYMFIMSVSVLCLFVFRYLSQLRYKMWFRQVFISFYLFTIQNKNQQNGSKETI